VLAFRVRLNRKNVATAGIPGAHVVTAIITSVVRDRQAQRTWPSDIPFERKQLTLEIGGLKSHRSGASEHVSWGTLDLKEGDTVTLTVARAAEVDEPVRRDRTEGPTIEDSERRELGRLRKKYGSDKRRSPSNKALQRTGRRPARR
jgi:hypothetical protein